MDGGVVFQVRVDCGFYDSKVVEIASRPLVYVGAVVEMCNVGFLADEFD